MNFILHVPLNASPEQTGRLKDLQTTFAEVCNALAPVVQQTRCWNRVALHHMVYKRLREQFPQMGSQMVCNAIYSVCRTSRLVYQSPESPFNVSRLGAAPLPLIKFGDDCPVYFDRHTLSVKAGELSMYTLDGRMRFQLALKPEDETNFHQKKLREIVLSRNAACQYELAFWFDTEEGGPSLQNASAATPRQPQPAVAQDMKLPTYVMVEEKRT